MQDIFTVTAIHLLNMFQTSCWKQSKQFYPACKPFSLPIELLFENYVFENVCNKCICTCSAINIFLKMGKLKLWYASYLFFLNLVLFVYATLALSFLAVISSLSCNKQLNHCYQECFSLLNISYSFFLSSFLRNSPIIWRQLST